MDKKSQKIILEEMSLQERVDEQLITNKALSVAILLSLIVVVIIAIIIIPLMF